MTVISSLPFLSYYSHLVKQTRAQTSFIDGLRPSETQKMRNMIYDINGGYCKRYDFGYGQTHQLFYGQKEMFMIVDD